MTTPSGITGPQDLAQTVREAVDPLDEHAPYGTPTNARDDGTSRPSQMQQLLEKRAEISAKLFAASNDYILENPLRSVLIGAAAGAALATLVFTITSVVRNTR